MTNPTPAARAAATTTATKPAVGAISLMDGRSISSRNLSFKASISCPPYSFASGIDLAIEEERATPGSVRGDSQTFYRGGAWAVRFGRFKPRTGGYVVKCNVCDQEFANSEDLKRHQEE